MADTDITLSVNLDGKDAAARAKNLQKEISRIFNATSGKKLDANMKSTLSQLAKMSNEAKKLTAQLEQIASTSTPTKEYQELENELQNLGKQSEALYTQLARLESGPKTSSATQKIKALEAELEVVEQKYDEVAAKQQELVDNGQAFTPGVESEEFAEASAKLQQLNNQMAVSTTRAYQLDNSLKSLGAIKSIFDNLGSGISQFGTMMERSAERIGQFGLRMLELPSISSKIGGAFFTAFGLMGNAIANGIQLFGRLTQVVGGVLVKALNVAGTAIKKVGGFLLNVAKTAGGMALNTFKRLGGAITSAFGAKSQKSVGGFRNSIGSLIGAMLGFHGIIGLLSELKQAIVDGMNNLARFKGGNNETNRSLSMLMSSLTQLKNAFAAAFAPILSIVAPVLNTLIQLLVTAANAVARFFAALGGKSTVVQAAKVQQDYAASLDKTKKSAGKTAKELGKLTGSYDELHVMDADDSSSDSGGGAEGLDPNSMFEEVPIDSNIQDMVDKIKEAWEKADFTEIGRIVGEKLKKALKDAEKWLDEVGQPLANKIGKSIATFLNGFFETPGLGYQLGKTIGALINTGLSLVNSFLDNTHFDSIGRFIGGALNGLTDKVDWEGIGHAFAQSFNALFDILEGIAQTWNATKTGEAIASAINKAIADFNWAQNGQSLSDFISKLFDVLIGCLSNIKWQDLGQGIADFINAIDWITLATKLATALSDFANGILTTLKTVLEEVDWKEIGESIKEFIKTIDWSGLATNLSESIGAALGGLAALLWGIIEEAWNDVVAWWEEAAFEDGKFTITGLLDGILEVLKNIGTWIYNNIFKPFIEGFQKAFGIASPSKVMKEQGNFIVEGLVEAIKKMPEKVIKFFTELKDKAVEKVVALKDNVIEKFDTLRDTAQEAIKTLKDNVVGFFSNIWEGKDGNGGIKGHVTTIYDGVVDKFNDIRTNVEDAIKTMKDNVIDFFGKLWTGIKSPINSILEGIEKFCNGVISGINGMIRALNSVSIDIPDWVPGIGGNSLGFNLSELSNVSLPRLAEGAVIPPNQEFLAMLGDQKQGTNIEAPLATIQEAVASVLEPYLIQIAGDTSNLANKDYSVRIGDRDIARAAKRGQRSMGMQLRTN